MTTNRCTDTGKKSKRKPKVRYPKERPNRDDAGMPCPCGGYADGQHDMTEKEIYEMQHLPRGMCGRSWQCCARAFKCRLCKSRLLAVAHAPDMG